MGTQETQRDYWRQLETHETNAESLDSERTMGSHEIERDYWRLMRTMGTHDTQRDYW